MMASDPRFSVLPDDYTEREQRRSKWTSCLIGCLLMAGVAMILLIVVVVWITKNARSWVADAGSQMLEQGIQSLDLPPQEKIEVKVQVDRVVKGFRDGTVTTDHIGRVVEQVFQSSLMPALVVAVIDKQYFEQSGLSAEEKAGGRNTMQRLARGMIERKIPQAGIDAVMAHVATRQSDGKWRLNPQVNDADLRAALAEAKTQADKAEIADAPEAVDPSDEIKKIIDEVLQEPAN